MLFYSPFIDDSSGIKLRLSKVKLSGFKSFVDPTTFLLTGRLNGIVGPNGCGKSNIIDAVRWVMGESSARQLRGQSMADVIFNGSTHRKPSGMASIELVFDNSSGTLKGQWADYNEISIRRLLDREGKSQYFLNGTRCRRRDITDIFMGTGLGPRSYAIIEQGMISRIVESKPDELRTFFEEAASISKYKEKRRETERRIEHTRENLDRLSDIRLELGKQLESLEKQAEVAKRYKKLKEEERSLDYWRLKSQRSAIDEALANLAKSGEAESKAFQVTVEHFNGAVEALFDGKNRLEAQEKTLKISHEKYYESKQLIEQIKHQLTMLNELKFRDSKSLEEWNERALLLNEEIAKHRDLLAEVEEERETLSMQIALNEEQLAELNEQLAQLEQNFNQLNDENNAKLNALNGLTQQISLDQNRHAFETDKIENFNQQKTRLNEELTNIPDHKIAQNAQSELEEILMIEQESIIALESTHEEQRDDLAELSDLVEGLNQDKNRLAQERSELNGKINALTALMQVKDAQAVTNPLYEHLAIRDNWNRAFDHVLSRWLMLSTDQKEGSYFLGEASFEFQPHHLGYYAESHLQLGTILSHVEVIEDLGTLSKRREALDLHQWLVTKEGDLYGRDWFVAFDQTDHHDGLLEREAEIAEATERVIVIDEQLNKIDRELKVQTDARESMIEAIATTNEALKHRKESLFAKEKELSLLDQENRHKNEAKARINQELARIEAGLAEANAQLEELAITIVTSEERLESEREAYMLFKAELDNAEQRYQQERKTIESQRIAFMDRQRQYDRLTNDQKSYQHTIQRAEAELKNIDERIAEKDIKTDYDEKIEEKSIALVSAEEKFATVEAELKGLEAQVAEIRESMKILEQNREDAEVAIANHREQIQQYALKETELKTQREMVESSWEELHDNLSEKEIGNLIQEYVDLPESDIRTLLSSVRQKLSKIGAVNLVAIEESKMLAERKVYLDSQDDDLNKALITLENAIREIDQETRERFMETFNEVNEDFGRLFPHLFGGGKAYLELTEEDALTSGVNIIAHPPGKKPGTIHLLSGGEKAMTAMALVFAIFNLNPAPFCMLDEVDAPLDEANVRRLGSLINEMSEKVQFIFITHNKTTMTISDTLTGVTMSEPGVSRIVSVDLEEALQYSESKPNA